MTRSRPRSGGASRWRLTRGAETSNLNVDREGEGGRVVVNHQALSAVLAALRELARADRRCRADAGRHTRAEGRARAAAGPAGPGRPRKVLHARNICKGVDAALDELVRSRRSRGRAARRHPRGAGERDRARCATSRRTHPGREPRGGAGPAQGEQIADLARGQRRPPEDRLAQGALLLATKADIREELDRLAALSRPRRVTARQGGPLGRKLDFLSQDFNCEGEYPVLRVQRRGADGDRP